MANVKLTRVQSGAALVKKLLERADNGDKVLTASELSRACMTRKRNRDGTTTDTWHVDTSTQAVLLAAINKQKSTGERGVPAIKKGVDEALKEIKAADLDRDGTLTAAEQKKVKSNLGRSLLAFSDAHAGHSADWFKIKPQEEAYVPTRPFRAPADASAAQWIDAAVMHFNGFGNDNSQHGRRPDSITRYVLGGIEARGVAKELEALPPAKAKAALRALAARINTRYPLTIEVPRRIWLDPDGEKVLAATAKKLGVTVDLHGEPRAPQFDYF